MYVNACINAPEVPLNRNGDGVEKDLRRGAQLYKEAAALGTVAWYVTRMGLGLGFPLLGLGVPKYLGGGPPSTKYLGSSITDTVFPLYAGIH